MNIKIGDKVKLIIHHCTLNEPYLKSTGKILKINHARALVRWDKDNKLLKNSYLNQDDLESWVLLAQLEVINEEDR